MKNFSILASIVFGILIFSLSQSVPLSFAAQGDINTIIDNLEFDTTIANTPEIIQINGDYFAVVYEGSDDDIILKTFTVGSTGTISNSAVDTQSIDTGVTATPKIMHITSDKYLIIYEDNGQIHGSVWTISNTGVITDTAVTAGAQIGTTSGTDPDVVLLSGTQGGTQYYAIAYRTSGGNGAVQTISVPAAGTSISAVANLATIGDTASDIEIVKLGDDKTAVAYRDSSNIGKVKVVNISDDGTNPNITGVPSAVSLNSGSALSSSSNLDFIHTNGTTYAVAWSDSSSNGKIQTLTIASDGSSASSTAIGSSFGSNVVDPVILQTDKASPSAFLVAYYDSSDTSGNLKSFSITSNGNTISNFSGQSLKYDTSSGQSPSIVHRTGNYYALAYSGSGGDGFVSSFDINTNDTTKPTLTGTVRITEVDASAPLDNFSKQGDQVTVLFTASEAIQTPTVTFGTMSGVSVSYTNTGGNSWNATATIPSTATEGTVTFSISVTDLAGNAINSAVTSVTDGSSVTVDLTNPSVSTLKVGENGSVNGDTDYAKTGDNMDVQLVANEQLSSAKITVAQLSSQDMDGTAPTTTWNRSTSNINLGSGTTEGTVTFSIVATDRAGNQATFTQSSITDGSSVVFDKTAPTFTSAKITGTKSLNILFSEPVLTDTGDYGIEWPDGSTRTIAKVGGSGTDTILVEASSGGSGTDTVDFSIAGSASGVTDRAGNFLSPTIALESNKITDDFVQPTLTSSDNQVVLSDDTLVTTISSTSVDPEVNLSGLTGGSNTATFPSSDITVDAEEADVVFPGGVVASGLPDDEIIEVSVSTKTADTSVLPAGETAGTIVELGDPDTTITFSAPVKVTLTGDAGKTAFIVTTSQTVLVPDCTSGSATVAPTLSTTSPTLDTSHCAVDGGSDLVIWTRHFTGFGASSPSGSSGGGGNDGDNTQPSISVGFDDNEFPVRYAGVNYDSNTIDNVHTAILQTGEELGATLRLYENEGPGNVRHVEMYVNQFGSRILNDLSETIIIYDEQTGLEIIDPHDLIYTADVIPSVSDNKAVFDFVVIFKDEIPQSDVIFRVWDLNRNQLELYLPDALIVNVSENFNAVTIDSELIEPESETTPSTPETTPSTPETTPSTPETTPSTPETTQTDQTKSWTDNQLSILKQWGGYEVETASDSDVLAKFGIKGEVIPSHYKQLVKWILNDQVSQEEFVNALQWLKHQGFLSESVGKQSFDVTSSSSLEGLTFDSEFLGEKIEFDDGNVLSIANVDHLEDVVKTLRSLANSAEIQNEILTSNTEFRTMDDYASVMNERDSEWKRNPNSITPFMESIMNNESAIFSKAIIEHHKDNLVPLLNIVITNEYGAIVASTEKTQDYKQSDEQWWGKTKSNGVYIMSGSSSEDYTGLYTSEISISVTDSQGNFIGVIKTVANFEKALVTE